MSADIMTPPGPRYGQPMSADDKLVDRLVQDIRGADNAIEAECVLASALEASEAKIAALTAENATLREKEAAKHAALLAVEEWWLTEGMKHFDGAPYAIFATRAALRQEGKP